MPAWTTIEQAEPEFAERVRKLFDAGRHKTIATLRADGSPRISGIECEFVDGNLRFGSMTGARKGADLTRDPRFALPRPDVPPCRGQGERMAGRGQDRRSSRSRRPGEHGRCEPGGGTTRRRDVHRHHRSHHHRAQAEATKLVVESWTPKRPVASSSGTSRAG